MQARRVIAPVGRTANGASPVPRSFLFAAPLRDGMQTFAIEGLPEVDEGDDLAALVDARVDFEDGDVLCIASTIVSKAEGRKADL